MKTWMKMYEWMYGSMNELRKLGEKSQNSCPGTGHRSHVT